MYKGPPVFPGYVFPCYVSYDSLPLPCNSKVLQCIALIAAYRRLWDKSCHTLEGRKGTEWKKTVAAIAKNVLFQSWKE